MKSLKRILVTGLLALCAAGGHAQYTFQSGSNGTNGAMNITTNTTLPLPPDGKFHCTTITVASNATLRFTSNALNTPVYLLATGDVVIDGTIDVSGSRGIGGAGGLGGPGGFAGGNAPVGNLPSGDGKGPGAGRSGNNQSAPYVGSAAYSTPPVGWALTTNNGSVYGGQILVPLVGGSGGGGSPRGPGVGGGGAILISSSTRIDVKGAVSASSPTFDSGAGNFGWGSGGAIRLLAPIVGGGGTLIASGGTNTYYNTRYGGDGRIRIDSLDRRVMALNCIPASALTIAANMAPFISNVPRLDITGAAGTAIPAGTNSSVFLFLPEGSSTNQMVTVQASNFGRVVPIRVMLTPDNGSSASYDSQIDNTAANPAFVTVPVNVPVHVRVEVNAWTR